MGVGSAGTPHCHRSPGLEDEHFGDAHEALNWFVFGLSEDCRLKVHRRGSVEYLDR